MNRVEAIRFDGVVAGFTAGIIVLCALFSAVLSISAGSRDVLAELQEGSRSHSSGTGRAMLRRVLLVVEVGLTVVLLVGAGLLLKSFERLRSSDIGVPVDNVLTMRLGCRMPATTNPIKKVAFFEQLIAGVRALPGVPAAGLVSAAPGEGWNGDTLFSIVEHPPLAEGPGIGLHAARRRPWLFFGNRSSASSRTYLPAR